MQVLFSNCNLTWPVINYVSGQGKGTKRSIKVQKDKIGILLMMLTSNCFCENMSIRLSQLLFEKSN